MHNSYLTLSQKLTSNLYILSAREAFIALIPYLILTSSLALASVGISSALGSDVTFAEMIVHINQGVYSLFPLLTLVSLSYYLAKNLNLARVACVVLSTTCFISVESQILMTEYDRQSSGQFSFHPTAILLPFFVAVVMNKVQASSRLQLIKSSAISSHLRHHINLIAPYLFTFILVTLLVYLLKPVATTLLQPLFDSLSQAGSTLQAGVRVAMIHLLWFLGIHGDNTYSLLVDSSYLGSELAPNLLVGDLINFFVLAGGSGAGWSLIIAILIYSRDSHSRHIAKISLPFAIFNINELLIFGLPIVFKPYLLIPFVLVPTLMFCGSLLGVSLGLVEFVPHSLSWITPPIINTWLASDGDVSTVLFQVAMIAMGVFIYAPFVKVSHLYNDDREVAEALATKLSLQRIITTPSDDENPQQNTLKRDIQDIDQVIEEILTGDLQLHYQPIVGKNQKIEDFAAQLRLKRSDGKVIELNFLHKLNRETVSSVIHAWLLKQLAQDMEDWSINHFYPRIHLPLDADILHQNKLVDQLIVDYGNQTERLLIYVDETSLKSPNTQIRDNLNKLSSAGFTLALRGFGECGTQLDNLLNRDVSLILLEPSLLAADHSAERQKLLQELTKLCQNLGYQVLINQLNSEADAKMAAQIGCDYRQGTFCSVPLPANEAQRLCANWNQKSHNSA